MQYTVNDIVEISGVGLHSGKKAVLTIKPAEIDAGITFIRTDIDGLDNVVPAKWDYVVNTMLCTVIGNEAGVTVSTIEHLMAALRAMGIDNAIIDIDGPETPILDGSSIEFCKAFEKVGRKRLDAPRRAIKVLKKVVYNEGDTTVSLSPSEVPVYKGQIDYAHPSIGSQRFEFRLLNGNFVHDVADSRTFCLYEDVENMRANGLAQGGSLDNAVVVNDSGIMNEEGLRCEDEFIRHKLLDAVGDLALAGGLVIGTYEGCRAGHGVNNKLLHTLFNDPEAYEIVDLYVEFESSDEIPRNQPVYKSTVPHS